MKMKRIDGFDYVTQKPVSLTRKEWINRIADAQKCGGRRRVEQGETFIHGPGAE
jgi:hypothetical protein